jgi:hypothetical protein
MWLVTISAFLRLDYLQKVVLYRGFSYRITPGINGAHKRLMMRDKLSARPLQQLLCGAL